MSLMSINLKVHIMDILVCICEQAIDMISAVKELHVLNSQELNKLLRDSDNFVIDCSTVKGSSIKVSSQSVGSQLQSC